MSFLEHLDEFRRRLVSSVIFVVIAFMGCWFVSDQIYNFWRFRFWKPSPAAEQAIADQRNNGRRKDSDARQFKGKRHGTLYFRPGHKTRRQLCSRKELRFRQKSQRRNEGKIVLFTDESIYTSNAIIPKGVEVAGKSSCKTRTYCAERRRKIDCDDGDRIFHALRYGFALCGIRAVHSVSCYGRFGDLFRRRFTGTSASYVTPFIGLSTISFVSSERLLLTTFCFRRRSNIFSESVRISASCSGRPIISIL